MYHSFSLCNNPPSKVSLRTFTGEETGNQKGSMAFAQCHRVSKWQNGNTFQKWVKAEVVGTHQLNGPWKGGGGSRTHGREWGREGHVASSMRICCQKHKSLPARVCSVLYHLQGTVTCAISLDSHNSSVSEAWQNLSLLFCRWGNQCFGSLSDYTKGHSLFVGLACQNFSLAMRAACLMLAG